MREKKGAPGKVHPENGTGTAPRSISVPSPYIASALREALRLRALGLVEDVAEALPHSEPGRERIALCRLSDELAEFVTGIEPEGSE
jgi:hypothetical protein